ncbi:alpha/beta hydrolase [Palleronia caenipelagi]|uniref:Alpha/beta hydrolase n=1 Tax=Palleronia caenipelagi TaxID=2489174 RepID=A0A547PNB5_9RHOB|nr:alpha/beta hydrolase [Palleronia caenipelagi]TRD15632.1 alpha/beta hydrolase [Palleronia caenipelagi]
MTYEALRADGTQPNLTLTFHGTGAAPAQLHGLAQAFMPDDHVVSPLGDVDENGSARFFRRTGEGIYDMDDLARAVAKMVAFISAETARTGATHVTGIGYSNGANILTATAMARPDLFDTLVLMHPLIPWDPAPCHGMAAKRVLITAGQKDPICPAPLTQRLAEWFTEQKADCLLAWHPGGHGIPQSEVEAVAGFLMP